MRNTTATSPGSSRLPAGLCRVHEHADARILRRSRSAALTGGCRLGFFASPRQLATSALGLLVPHDLNFQWDRGRKRSVGSWEETFMPRTYMSDGLHVPQTISYLLGKPCSCPSVASKPWSWVHWKHLPRSLVVHLLVPKLYFSLPLRRLLEESTGLLLEEEGGSQRCSARKLVKVRQPVVVDWPP